MYRDLAVACCGLQFATEKSVRFHASSFASPKLCKAERARGHSPPECNDTRAWTTDLERKHAHIRSYITIGRLDMN